MVKKVTSWRHKSVHAEGNIREQEMVQSSQLHHSRECHSLRDRTLRRIDIESIVIHDLRPSCNEILRKLLFRVGAGIDFSEGAQLRVRSEDEVDASGGPFELVGL